MCSLRRGRVCPVSSARAGAAGGISGNAVSITGNRDGRKRFGPILRISAPRRFPACRLPSRSLGTSKLDPNRSRQAALVGRHDRHGAAAGEPPIQSSAKQRVASAAPSVPPTCGRRSLQSRHGRQNTRLPDALRRPRSRPKSSERSRCRLGTAPASSDSSTWPRSTAHRRSGRRADRRDDRSRCGRRASPRRAGRSRCAAAPGCAAVRDRHDLSSICATSAEARR